MWVSQGFLQEAALQVHAYHSRLQASFLDVEPLELERHAVRRSLLAANTFYLLHPLTVLGMAFMGGRHAVSK